MAEIFFESSLEGSKIILLNKYLTITNNNTDNNDNKPNLSESNPVKPATLAFYWLDRDAVDFRFWGFFPHSN